jgi:spore maturation protein CgeB
MNIAFFGSSLLSAYWNGAATYYRGIIKALHERGHRITFYEPDAFERQKHRDISPPPWAKVVVYENSSEAMLEQVEAASRSDVVIKASGVGVFDQLLERAVLESRRPGTIVAFWDVDAPATLDRVCQDIDDPFLSLIPNYDLILTYGGGEPVVSAYTALGARECVPIYNGLDCSTHHPVNREERFDSDLSFLGNRLPDREQRVEEFFFDAAAILPKKRFLLGGSGWDSKPRPANVEAIGHVYTRDHNALNCSAKAVLNISRESMARYGFSPATRVFEAAGAGACIISDAWNGIDCFFEPGREILVARNGQEVADLVSSLTPEAARRIGTAAFTRALNEHTYARRAAQVELILDAVGAHRFRIMKG